MPNHQSSVVSVAIVLTAVTTVIVLGFGLGRASAAWHDVRGARREVPKLRRIAWGRTRGVAGGFLMLIAVLAVAVNEMVR
jgi:hypothetical protein